MRKATVLLLGATTLLTMTLLTMTLLLGSGPGRAEAGEAGAAAHAQKTWNDTCQKCHTVPDATFETGRAFLAQITETS